MGGGLDLNAHPAYYINLDRRHDRRSEIEDQLERAGIRAERHPAVDGQEIPLDEVRAFRARHPSSRQNRTLSNIAACLGCLRSLRGALERAEGAEVVSIFEDDAQFRNDFQTTFAEYVEEVPDDWIMLSLGLFHKAKPERVSKHVRRCKKTNSTHALIVRGEGIPLLHRCFSDERESADFLLQPFYESRRFYAFHPPLVIQRKSYSDITGSVRNPYYAGRKLLN